MLPRRPSAPLAASGLALCALAVVALASAPSPAPPEKPPLARRPSPTEATRELAAGQTLDVNAAGTADLELLPRIGPTLAQRIVDDRRENGPFPSVEALTRVRGIGPRTLDGLRPHVRVGVAHDTDAGALPAGEE
ncbi:MAG: ComEA family DNA-binding protein [Sandaracinaceae bacterium]